ncbi:hypothetical protein [Bacillus fonticola]|uniref:hypothetical protein n=1 Tax=Bacillus fonticola TaxID=2728853 RepID=UPI0014762BFA|nr:hypothetical protein [Bacillus fonticola]
MSDRQEKHIQHLKEIQLEQSNSWFDYWMDHSNFGTWEFWANVAFLILPLITLFIVIDRRKALLLGFYGYNVHVFFTYIDAYSTSRVSAFYPYKVLPILPSNFALDVSFVPVAYMLVYQWTLHHKKNYYLYITLLCLFLAFVFKPLLVYLGLFQIIKMNYFDIFLLYLVLSIVSKWVTNVFIFLEKRGKNKS